MFRLIALTLSLLLALTTTPVFAQSAATWQRTYPERTQPACTWIVAQWSDGTYSASAWECDAGQAAVRSDGASATRGYPQVADNGCTEYVSQWSDQSYSWVPYTCPNGVVYPKTKSRGVQPLIGGSAPAAPPAVQQPSGRQQGTVSRIVDGDTFDVQLPGGVERVRLIGIDTPEVSGQVECYGREASQRLAQLIPPGTVVDLEKDVSERDQYGRLLRYVFAGGRMINEVMVAEGYAHASTYPPDVKHQGTLAAAQNQARSANRGLWGACTTQAPVQPPVQQPVAPVVPPAAPPANPPAPGGGSVPPATRNTCPPSHPIKGNQSGIYHLPGQQYYNVTNPEECFATEADAQRAGYRKSRV